MLDSQMKWRCKVHCSSVILFVVAFQLIQEPYRAWILLKVKLHNWCSLFRIHHPFEDILLSIQTLFLNGGITEMHLLSGAVEGFRWCWRVCNQVSFWCVWDRQLTISFLIQFGDFVVNQASIVKLNTWKWICWLCQASTAHLLFRFPTTRLVTA